MRIRKTLAKALGQYESPSFPPPSETPISLSTPDTSVGSSVLFCQLNQSPWDVYPNHRFLRTTFKIFERVKSLQHPKEEDEDKFGEISEYEKDVDVLGKNTPTMDMAEEKPLVRKRFNVENKREMKGEINKGSNETIMCKKNDGRNWFCKRPAKLPHNLCDHHLAQSRSYKENVSSGTGSGYKSKKQKEIGESSSDFYYYGTVMPSRGKRRCARNVDNCAIDVEEEKVDNKEELGANNEDYAELHDLPAASGSKSDQEVIIIGAKRARKLVKYRSLESLPVAEPKSSATGGIE